MSNCSEQLTQGDSLAVSGSLDPKQDMTGWTNRVMLKSSDNVPVLDKTMATLSTDTFEIIGSITPLETSAIDPGTYTLVRLLSNSDNSLSKEENDRLVVLPTEIV